MNRSVRPGGLQENARERTGSGAGGVPGWPAGRGGHSQVHWAQQGDVARDACPDGRVEVTEVSHAPNTLATRAPDWRDPAQARSWTWRPASPRSRRPGGGQAAAPFGPAGRAGSSSSDDAERRAGSPLRRGTMIVPEVADGAGMVLTAHVASWRGRAGRRSVRGRWRRDKG